MHQGGHGPAVGGDVVVAEQVVLGARHQVEHGVGRGAEADVAHPHDPGPGQRGVDPVGRVLGAGVDDQHVEVGVVLVGEGRHQPVEPVRARVMGDDDGHDGARRGGGRRVRLHDVRRVPPTPSRAADPGTRGARVGAVQGITAEDLGRHAENAVYTAVGLGILGFQHLAVQRREIQRSLETTVRAVVEAAERTVAR